MSLILGLSEPVLLIDGEREAEKVPEEEGESERDGESDAEEVVESEGDTEEEGERDSDAVEVTDLLSLPDFDVVDVMLELSDIEGEGQLCELFELDDELFLLGDTEILIDEDLDLLEVVESLGEIVAEEVGELVRVMSRWH